MAQKAQEERCLCKAKELGPSPVSEEMIEKIQEAFAWSPRNP